MHSTHLFSTVVPFLSLSFVALSMGFLTNEYDFSQKVCVFEGRVLFPGRRFKSDPCTTCRCPRRGGQVVCTVEDCRDQYNCLRLSNATSRGFRSCCPKCLEYGCRHTDGHVYKRGEIISRDGCSRCYCPRTGGPATCDITQCPPIMCVDFVHQPGNCCPRCPKGPNCQLGRRIIPRGAVVTSAGKSVCWCRLKRRGSNLKLEAHCVGGSRDRGSKAYGGYLHYKRAPRH